MPCCRPRSAIRRSWPSPRRSWTTRPAGGSSWASAPAGSTRSTRRSGSRSRRCPSGSTASNRRSTRSGRSSRPRPPRTTGVTRADPFFPLVGATNDPPPLTPGGPPIWLGGQKRRGIALAAAVADGWLLPAVTPDKNPTDMTYFADRRDAILAALEAIGRDPATFALTAQVPAGTTAESRREGLEAAQDAVRLGATHVIVGMPPRLGAAGVDDVAADDRRAAARGDRMTVAVRPAVDDGRPRDHRPHRQRRSAPRSRHRSRRCAGPTARIRAGRGCWPSSRANRSGRRRSDGSTCTRPSSTATGARSTCCPTRVAGASGAALLVAISEVARDAGKSWLHIPATRGTARRHRVPRAPWLHRVRTVHVPPPRPVRARAADGPATRRGRDHDAGGAARSRARRPRGRPGDLRRHPRATNRWRRATWPSSALAMSTARRSRRGASRSRWTPTTGSSGTPA